MATAVVMKASHRATRVTAAPAPGLTSLPYEIRDNICFLQLQASSLYWEMQVFKVLEILLTACRTVLECLEPSRVLSRKAGKQPNRG